MAIYKLRRKVLEETNPAEILTSDFQPPELWGNKYLFFKSLSLWCFAMAALANQYNHQQQTLDM